MKTMLANTGYFLRESFTMLRLQSLSNALSLISMGLIFFLLAMVLSGWWTSSHITEMLQSEAEINVFYDQSMSAGNVTQLAEGLKGIDGVREVRLVGKDEAYSRMKGILGEEASVLEVFSDNPFNPFLEVRINLDKTDSVLKAVEHLAGIQHIRNNKDILDRIHNLSELIKVFGILILCAVGMATLIIISHIIRQGITIQREQITTLRLLGAPEPFIALPFVLEGLLLTLGGGIFAVVLAIFTINKAYALTIGSLSFFPLLPAHVLISDMLFMVLFLSVILGLFGSILGLKLADKK